MVRKAVLVVILIVAAGFTGCRLYFWAGDHELTVPPLPSPTATPTPEVY